MQWNMDEIVEVMLKVLELDVKRAIRALQAAGLEVIMIKDVTPYHIMVAGRKT
jgi:ribosomal protein S11